MLCNQINIITGKVCKNLLNNPLGLCSRCGRFPLSFRYIYEKDYPNSQLFNTDIELLTKAGFRVVTSCLDGTQKCFASK